MRPERLLRQAARVSRGEWLPLRRRLASRRTVAITIDDGPSVATPEILSILADHQAVASFFISGRRAELWPELVRAIVDGGHGVYSHAFSHSRLADMDGPAVIEEMARTEALLERVRTPLSPYLVRLPYGSGHDSLKVHRLLRAWRPDVEIVHWDYSFHDWTLADGCTTVAEVEARCEAAVDTAFATPSLGGAILLMHEDPIDCAAPLAAAIAPALLRALLPRAIQGGLSPVGLDQPPASQLISRFVRPRVVF